MPGLRNGLRAAAAWAAILLALAVNAIVVSHSYGQLQSTVESLGHGLSRVERKVDGIADSLANHDRRIQRIEDMPEHRKQLR